MRAAAKGSSSTTHSGHPERLSGREKNGEQTGMVCTVWSHCCASGGVAGRPATGEGAVGVDGTGPFPWCGRAGVGGEKHLVVDGLQAGHICRSACGHSWRPRRRHANNTNMALWGRVSPAVKGFGDVSCVKARFFCGRPSQRGSPRPSFQTFSRRIGTSGHAGAGRAAQPFGTCPQIFSCRAGMRR